MSENWIHCSSQQPVNADGSARPFDPAWRTETVLLLAKAIEAEQAFDRMPILADALQETGCDDEELLRHCRECERHEPECWVPLHVLAHFSSDYQPTPGLPVSRVYRERVQATSTEERTNHRFAIIWLILLILPVSLFLLAARIGAGKSSSSPFATEPNKSRPSDQFAELCRFNLQRLLQIRTEWVELAKTHAEDSHEYQAKGQEFWDAIDSTRVSNGLCGVTFPERPKILSHRTAPIILVPENPR